MTELALVHPHKDRLIAFGQGRLAPEEAETIEQHLGMCGTCCETLMDLKDDTFIALLRESEAPRAKIQAESHSSGHAATIVASRPSNPKTADDSAVDLENHSRYRIIELIGQGGMGKVYRAEHRLMNRQVAIKVISSQLIQNGQAVERFRREVQAAARLSHANIVTAYDAEQAGGAHFLVMEFVKGIDLATIVTDRGPLTVAEACDFVRQAADGLQHAHEQGMVHRDIKPHNLMLAASGRVRILDFGLAGFATEAAADVTSVRANEHPDAGSADRGHLTTMGSVMGTPDYMAPEQAADAHSTDIRADIYSLGCTLHFLLTGKPPFEADNVVTKLKAHAEQLPSSLTLLRKDVPPELSKVAARMMAKNPAERYQTPADVAEALAPFAKSAAIASKRRRRTLIAVAMLGLAALLAYVIYVEIDKGQFIVETVDEQVAVMVGDQGLTIRDTVTGREYRLKSGTQRVRTGEYEMNVTELPEGLEVKTTRFTVKRGDAARVSVTFKPKHEHGTDPGSVSATAPVEQRLQGKWVAVSGHARQQPMPAEQLAHLSIAFDGDQTTFNQPGIPPGSQRGTFRINANRNPKQIDFVAPDKRETMPGIFEFDGERLKLALVDEDYARPSNFDPDDRPDHMTLVLERVSVAETLNDEERQVLKAAEAFLAMMDDGRFGELFNMSSMLAKRQATRGQLSQTYQQLRDTVGEIEKRSLQRVRLMDEFIGLPPGRYAAVLYRSDFKKHKGLWESVLLNVDDDGQWRSNTYAATVQPLPLPEPKANRQPGADNKVTRPSLLGPPPALPLGKNLITDPSLEGTAPNQPYPAGWGTGNVMPPNAYKHQVVEGGRTGKRAWAIEGDGQFAVIPTNRPPAHPAYRYAASGWVQVESGSAQIKLLYFDADGRYIGENRGNVTIKQEGWHRLTMTDDLKTFREARSLSLALTLMGNGKAVFDDLELIAFDANKLPARFEEEHGATKHFAAVFDRWVGRWESTTIYKPTAVTPNQQTIKGNVVVRKILDDRFLLWQWVTETGNLHYLSVLGFDENIEAYRFWVFSSTGEAFERVGQWDSAAQTLVLDVKSPSPGVKGVSTDRFVSDDRIESTLLVTSASGQVARDMEATWIRKSSTVPDERVLSDGPAAGSEDLTLLNKLAGEWTIRQTMKPSVWFPDGATKMITERTGWAVGGRLLLFRLYDEKQRLTTLGVTMYEPAEKSYHYWHFSPDAFGGQWRITWDSASRSFHWRSIDMPTGWIGTGFNRWVNDDTFDSQSLIKDENGRVMLDSTEDKRRKK